MIEENFFFSLFFSLSLSLRKEEGSKVTFKVREEESKDLQSDILRHMLQSFSMILWIIWCFDASDPGEMKWWWIEWHFALFLSVSLFLCISFSLDFFSLFRSVCFALSLFFCKWSTYTKEKKLALTCWPREYNALGQVHLLQGHKLNYATAHGVIFIEREIASGCKLNFSPIVPFPHKIWKRMHPIQSSEHLNPCTIGQSWLPQKERERSMSEHKGKRIIHDWLLSTVSRFITTVTGQI